MYINSIENPRYNTSNIHISWKCSKKVFYVFWYVCDDSREAYMYTIHINQNLLYYHSSDFAA